MISIEERDQDASQIIVAGMNQEQVVDCFPWYSHDLNSIDYVWDELQKKKATTTTTTTTNKQINSIVALHEEWFAIPQDFIMRLEKKSTYHRRI